MSSSDVLGPVDKPNCGASWFACCGEGFALVGPTHQKHVWWKMEF